jgi:NTP pyrophosphatase (non-canonical NTP hydrolase)
MNNRLQILIDIFMERERQNRLHPERLSLPMRFVTISEEIGEIAEALQEGDMKSVYRELIDTAATCVRMAEEMFEGD